MRKTPRTARRRAAGDDLQLEFAPGDGGPATSAKLKCGVVYRMSRGADGKVQFSKIGVK